MLSPPPRPRGRPSGGFTQRRRFDALRDLLVRRPRGMSLQEIADALQVTTRSARRYLRELKVEFELDKVDVGNAAPLWRLSAEDRPKRVALRRAQAYALLAARGVFEPLRGSALFEELELANKDILAVACRPGRGPNAGIVDTALEERFLYLAKGLISNSPDTERLDVLYHCVSELRPMRCRLSEDAAKTKNVKLLPYAMILYNDSVFAVGSIDPDPTIQIVPIESISDASTLDDEHFQIPAGFRVRDYCQGSLGLWLGTDKTRTVIDFSPLVAPDLRNRQIHPSQKISHLRGGGMRLTLMISDPDRLASWVLSFSDNARVVEPESLRSLVIQKLKNAASLYRDRSTTSPAQP